VKKIDYFLKKKERKLQYLLSLLWFLELQAVKKVADKKNAKSTVKKNSIEAKPMKTGTIYIFIFVVVIILIAAGLIV